MGSTFDADFKVFNGTDYDQYNFSTIAKQVKMASGESLEGFADNVNSMRGIAAGDADEITTPGAYWCDFTNSSNFPWTNGYGWMEVVASSANSLMQRVTRFYSDGTTYNVITRYYANGTWYAWRSAGDDQIVTFSAAANRTKLTSGERLTVSLGKIAKWFSDLEPILQLSFLSSTASSYFPTTRVYKSGRAIYLACSGYTKQAVSANLDYAIATLPGKYCPPAGIVVYVPQSAGQGIKVYINTDGTVKYNADYALGANASVNININYQSLING